MASLIPDTGSLSTNTTGAMQNYLNTVRSTNDALEKPTDILNTHIKNMLDQRRIEEDMALKRSADARAQTELGMQQAERDRINKERTATNEAIQAVVNPNQYGAGKMATEQSAIQQSLANLSPEERVVAEQQIKANYDPMASQKGWLDVATNAQGVDVGRMLDIKNRDYEVKAKTPGTPEYIAAQNAQFDLYKKEQDVTSANRMREIAAQNAGSIKILEMQQNAPIHVVDKDTGASYTVRPSEMGKNPNWIFADTFNSLTQRQNELQKQEYERTKNEQKLALEGKEKVAKTLGGLGNQDSVLSAIGGVNSIAKNYGVDLTDTDINTAMESTVNASRFDFGKPDVDTDLMRQRLASIIATKSKKPLEEVLGKIEGKNTSTLIPNVSPTTTTSNNKEPFSLFGVTAPTEYNALQNSSNYGIDPKVSAAKAKYDLLPEYVKKDVSLGMYMDKPSSYEYLLKK